MNKPGLCFLGRGSAIVPGDLRWHMRNILRLGLALAFAPASLVAQEAFARDGTPVNPPPQATTAVESKVAPPVPGMELGPGSQGVEGPPVIDLQTWQAKEKAPAAAALNLQDKTALPMHVTRRAGRNPFTLKTRAGERELGAGLDVSISRRGANAQVIGIVVPTVPAQQAVSDLLMREGFAVLGVQGPQSYVVRGHVERFRTLANNPLVFWAGVLPWQMKVDPLLAGHLGLNGLNTAVAEPDAIEQGTAWIALYDPEAKARVEEALRKLNVQIVRYDEQLHAFKCEGVTADAVTQIAEMDEVSFVDASRLPEANLETSVAYAGHHDVIRDTYTFGSGVLVAMIDSGLEFAHSAFQGWSPYPPLWGFAWNVSGQGSIEFDNPSGHGTHVAGIILSRWHPVDLHGMAPFTGGSDSMRFRWVRTGRNTGNPTTIWNADLAIDILNADNVALVINNSWGNGDPSGTDAISAKADAAVWATEQIFVFAAGNDGPGVGTIGSPGAAKNVITVGSVQNKANLALSGFSSRGPTSDGRNKPDIFAPGGGITSADKYNLNGAVDFSGTSMATPHVTGFLATLLDHYPVFQRRSALAKAMLRAAATRRADLDATTGLLNSYESHWATPGTGAAWGWYDTDPRPFEYIYWDVDDLPAGLSEVTIVLSWTEPNAPVGAASAVLNDVDLWVDHNKDEPGFGEWSSTSSNDNVEVIRLTNPPAGSYRIHARKISAATEYRLGYALFYRGLPPSAPTGVSASDGTLCDTVQVSWNASAGATSYNVYRDGVYVGSAASSPYDDTPGDTVNHSYRVTAVGTFGESPFSNANTGRARDCRPVISLAAPDATAGEPGTGEGNGRFRFSRSGSTDLPLTVYFTVGGTAGSGADYVALGTSVTFDVGVATLNKDVTVIDDATVEEDETVELTLAPDAAYVVGNSSNRVVSIKDDDVPTLPLITVVANDANAGEPGTDHGAGRFRFTRTGSTASALTVNFSVGGTATSGSDYSFIGTSISFGVGKASVNRNVTVLDDAAVESPETIELTLVPGSGYAIGTPSAATITVHDDDVGGDPGSAVVTVTAVDAIAGEPGSGQGGGKFRFTRTGPTDSALTVHFTVSGTATPASDYGSLGTSITIAAGAAAVNRNLNVADDSVVEGEETVIVTLNPGTGYSIGTPDAAAITIQDDD